MQPRGKHPGSRRLDAIGSNLTVSAVVPSNREVTAVSVVLVSEGPNLTQETYEQVVGKMTGGKNRMESPSDWPVEGLLVHAAGQGPRGFRVVDVWESEEACNRFGEILAPLLQELGAPEEPQLYPAFAFVSA